MNQRIASLLLTLAVCGPLLSQSASAETERATGERRTWYGWQTLALDGIAIAATTAGVVEERGALAGAGIAGYFFGAPVVHFAHGNWGRGFGSLGLRVGGPLDGAIIGGLVGPKQTNCAMLCGPGPGAIVGAGVGAVSAMALDAAFLAYDREPARMSVAVVPAADDGGQLVLSGSF
jgi:hypothetical protein